MYILRRVAKFLDNQYTGQTGPQKVKHVFLEIMSFKSATTIS